MSEISAIRAVERPGPPQVIEPSFVPQRRAEPPPSNRLEPAVTLDLSADAPTDPAARGGADRPAASEAPARSALERGQFVRDAEDARRIVYQIVDPGSGDVVIQLPSVAALKARAYAEAAATRSADLRQADSARQSAAASRALDRSA